MGGLGNGRRVGRAPPLMIAALIACILVLGFNYWVSSSRNLELQTKLYELENQVRHGVAVELQRNEFEEEIKKQKDQIITIESVYQRKLEEVQDTCSQIKATLQQNISSSTLDVHGLREQLNKLNDDLEKLHNELLSCQGNVDTLNLKLTYDTNQCQSQILSEKEICEERVAAAKLEAQKNMEKQNSVAPQENANPAEKDEDSPRILAANASDNVSHAPALDQKDNSMAELRSNDIDADKGASDVKDQTPTKAPTAGVKQDNELPPEGAAVAKEDQIEIEKPEDDIPTEDKEMELIDGRIEEDTDENDPGMEDLLIQGKEDENEGNLKVEEPEEYDADEPVVRGVDLEKPQELSENDEKPDKEKEAEVADYNGDEENVGEFEADKQAELSRI
ncbi:unnamed protein product [Ophioblennius macclurei]